ncbi:MAG: 2TM domain-containing protein [Betaproteobacteria bacterium]|nr:2TM domain-containing protein [Betaproteobacteria bacterium]
MSCNYNATTDINTLARRRAGAKLGFYIHASVYVLVNAFLIYLSMSHDRNWHFGPLLGWGLGLAIHGFKVFMASPGSSIFDRMVETERKKLAA